MHELSQEKMDEVNFPGLQFHPHQKSGELMSFQLIFYLLSKSVLSEFQPKD
jgi:hypothetical protein